MSHAQCVRLDRPGFGPWGGYQLFKRWKVEIVQKWLPSGDDPGEQWAI